MANRKSKSRSGRSGGRAKSRSRPKRATPRSSRKKASARRGGSAKPKRRTGSAPRSARTATTPNRIGAMVHHVDFTSHDMEGVRRFYTEILGFGRFTHDPSFNYLMVMTGPSSSIGFMPPMPGPPEQWRPPREPSTYFMVKDVDRASADLKAKGVIFEQEATDMPWGHRVAVLRDPEGRMICLAQQLER
jgi:predicted enzyme related to lactoylglutathione lyase